MRKPPTKILTCLALITTLFLGPLANAADSAPK